MSGVHAAMQTVQVSLERELVARLRHTADARGLSVARVIRDAVNLVFPDEPREREAALRRLRADRVLVRDLPGRRSERES